MAAAEDVKEEEVDLGEEFRTNISEEEKKQFREDIWKIRHPNQKERNQLWPNDCEPSKRSLRGVATEYVYEWTEGQMWYRCYVLEVHAFVGIEYILDFTGTTNHTIQGTFGFEDNKVCANLNPFELETICLVERDITKDHNFEVNGRWGSCKIHPIILANAIAIEMNKTKDEYDDVLGAGLNEYSDISTIRDTLFKKELLFVDGSFYPSNDSLYLDGDQSDKNEEEFLMWRRIGDFWKQYPRIFATPNSLKQCVHPSYVKQGDVDDAWLIAAIASIALKPELIERLFITKDDIKAWESMNDSNNKKGPKNDLMFGFLRMRMCMAGIWRDTFVDDFLPCKAYGKPVYCNTPKAIDQLWPSMIEKCYAKMYGCYERLSGADPRTANPRFAFTDLTQCPGITIDFSDYSDEELDGLWNKMEKWSDTREALLCGLCNEYQSNDDATIESVGLETGHAYSLLDARKNSDVKLVCLREPFGFGGWNGDWSEKSSKWTQQTMQEFGLNDMKSNGTFWMDFNDFVKYFSSVSVCFVGTNENPLVSASIGIDIGIDQKENELILPIVNLKVSKGCCVEWVGMHQQDIRNPKVKSYLDMSLFVYKESNDNGRVPFGYLNSSADRQKFEIFGDNYGGSKHNEFGLEEGTYYLIPFTTGNNWSENDGPTRGFGLTLHGYSNNKQSPIYDGSKVFEMSIKDGYNERKQINQVLLDFALKFGSKTMWKDLDRRELKMGTMTIYGGKNCSKNEEYTFKMKGENLDNIENGKTYSNFKNEQAFNLKPNESKLFGVQIVIDPNKSVSPVYKFGLSTKKL